ATHAGLGVSATVFGRTLRLGRGDFALTGKRLPRDYEDAVLLADDAGPIAAFRVTERLRVDAVAALDALRTQDMTVLISSGDASTKVSAIAERVNVDTWRARAMPADKLAWLAD